MWDDRARDVRSDIDEFKEQRRQRMITARLTAVALALAALAAFELSQRNRSDQGSANAHVSPTGSSSQFNGLAK